ncbi:MAG: hypothetical protein IKR05_06165 [Prevotella sp.]|nr:hypothetical protein [Prevotella sp.]
MFFALVPHLGFLRISTSKKFKVQEKYVLLCEFARPNRDWADKAAYIEFLYFNDEEHRKDIDMLWVMKRKRMGQ